MGRSIGFPETLVIQLLTPMKSRLLSLFVLFSAAGFAQLSTDQRAADFRNLYDLYARYYAPAQWKKDLLQYDLLNLSPWMDRIQGVTNDLDFYDVMIDYVASLQDAHDQYIVPSDFDAYLGFYVDIYDGKLLIDQIDRTVLSSATYPFQVGDQLVSVDGKSGSDLLTLFSKYQTGANARTQQRFAAMLITERYQGYYPHAPEVGDMATVVIQRQSGATETYNIPWQKIGTPLTTLGASPGPTTVSAQAQARRVAAKTPIYQKLLEQMHDYSTPKIVAVTGFDELAPTFSMPSNFVQRLGKRVTDYYFTGTYTASDGTRVGFLRIPDFLYAYTPDLDREIKYFQTNTDVLVVDVMRHPGGSPCDAEDAIARLTTNQFQGAVSQFRVTWSDVVSFAEGLDQAIQDGLDDDTIAQFQLYRDSFKNTYLNNQGGLTDPLPVCGSTTTRTPVSTAYTKPVMVLVDDMTFSAGEVFAALVQDNHIATLFGYRTPGAGGVLFGLSDTQVGFYSEGSTSVTRGLTVRSQAVVTSDYPTTNYIENVGVRPDVTYDYMTADNLVNHGAAFVQAFTDAAVKLAKGGK